jgi:hypothetical protein
MEDENPQKDQSQGCISPPLGHKKGDQEERAHGNSPYYPCDTINFYDGTFFGQQLSHGQEEEGYIDQGIEQTDNGGGCIEPHRQENNYSSNQKLPGKRIENIKQIVKIPCLTKTIRRKHCSHI